MFSVYVYAFLIGVVTGLRSLTAPALVSWAARLGWLHLENTPLAFLGYAATPYIFTLLAIGELIADQLPQTPSRKAPPGFIARILMGALCGAALPCPVPSGAVESLMQPSAAQAAVLDAAHPTADDHASFGLAPAPGSCRIV